MVQEYNIHPRVCVGALSANLNYFASRSEKRVTGQVGHNVVRYNFCIFYYCSFNPNANDFFRVFLNLLLNCVIV